MTNVDALVFVACVLGLSYGAVLPVKQLSLAEQKVYDAAPFTGCWAVSLWILFPLLARRHIH
jgi:hypothetical protein